MAPPQQPPDPAKEIFDVLRAWVKPSSTDDLDKFGELTTRSLDTVTHLTEYEDEKANRILTAMAFISAFAGVLFAAVVGHYSTGYLQQLWEASHWRFILLVSSYALFGLYALAVSLGASWSLYGMRPRFNVPKGFKAVGSRPGSFLFFPKIIEVSAADWAKAFTGTTGDDLAFQYVRNNILETYLIAEKIPKKLTPLKKANTLYIGSACILIAWVVVAAVAIASIDFWPSPAVSAIKSGSAANDTPSVPQGSSENAASSQRQGEQQEGKGEATGEMLRLLNDWHPTFSMDKFYELTAKSLDTVTHLVEYEDEKANRILTAVAFISAFAAVVFAAIIARYPGNYLRKLRDVSRWRFKLLISGQALFAVYALVVVSGALFSVMGLRPTFVIPRAWRSPGSAPSSYLFAPQINRVRPSDWASAFTRRTNSEELLLEYVKNDIAETYLVAEGVSLKLEKLRAANLLYVISLGTLLLWVIVTGVAICSIEVTPKAALSAIRGNSTGGNPTNSS